MRNVLELSKYELYKTIFEPIFGIQFKYSKHWDIEKIINEEWRPLPYSKKYYPDIQDKIDEYENDIRDGETVPLHYLHGDKYEKILSFKEDILAENGFYDRGFDYPVINKNIEKDYISIELSYTKNYRLRTLDPLDEEIFKTNYDNSYIRFYDNKNIMLSNKKKHEFRTSLLNKNTSIIFDNTPRYLSYTETLEMIEYFKEKEIDTQKEIDFQI